MLVIHKNIPEYKVNIEKIKKTINTTITSYNFKKSVNLFILEDSSFVGYDFDENFYIGKFYNVFHLSMFIIKKYESYDKDFLIFNGKLNRNKNNIEGFFEKISLNEGFDLCQELRLIDSNVVEFINEDNISTDKLQNIYYNCCRPYSEFNNSVCCKLLTTITPFYKESVTFPLTPTPRIKKQK